MNDWFGTLFVLSLRHVLGQRRVLLVLLLALVPIAAAGIFFGWGRRDPADWTANVLGNGVVISAVVPLATLLLGTAVFGSEIEDGTLVYLLSKPLPRWGIVLAKALAAFFPIALLLSLSSLLSGLLATWEEPLIRVTLALAASAMVAAAGYVAVFVALSLVTSRAMIVGLAYAFIWEGAVTSFLSGAQYLSVRQYALGVFDALAGLPDRTFDEALPSAPLLAAAVIAGALLLATRRLERWEVKGGE